MGNLTSKMKRSRSKEKKEKGKRGKKDHRPLPESSSAKKTVDPRLPFSSYRQVFGTRNAWKTVHRTLDDTAKDNLMRFFEKYPHHKEHFPNLQKLTTDEDIRNDLEFESTALEVFQTFDDLMENLENLDVALMDLRREALNTSFTMDMLKDMRIVFMDTLRLSLGDRFTDGIEDNFGLLYDFVISEMEKSAES